MTPEEQAEEPAVQSLNAINDKQRFVMMSLDELMNAMGDAQNANLRREGVVKEGDDITTEKVETAPPSLHSNNINDLNAALDAASQENSKR